MKEWFSRIQQKMEGMTPKEKRAYIRQYYWHYFLIGGDHSWSGDTSDLSSDCGK